MSACDRYRCMSSFSWWNTWKGCALSKLWVLLYLLLIIWQVLPHGTTNYWIYQSPSVFTGVLGAASIVAIVGGFLVIVLPLSLLYVIFKRIQFAMRKEGVEESSEE